MSAIAIPAQSIPEAVLLSQEGIDKRDALAETAHRYANTGITTETFEAANAHYLAMSAFEKEVEATRKAIKGPIDAIAAQVQACAKEAVEGIATERQRLGSAIHIYQQEENRKRAEAAQKAREEAEAKARAEQARLDEEAREKALLEAGPFDDAPVAVVADVQVRPAAVYVPPPIKSAVKAVTKEEVIIDDKSAVPFEVNGIRLWKEIDMAACKMLLKQGKTIPGMHLETGTDVRAKGARS